jgi:hypothetical protein
VPLATRFVAAILLSSVLCGSATGQEPQPLTPQQIRHVKKVTKSLAHYDTETTLDVLLNDGSHQIGILSQVGSTSFVLTDTVTHKPETIDDLNVKRVGLTRKGYLDQTAGKTLGALPIVATCAVAFVLVLAVVAIKNGDR